MIPYPAYKSTNLPWLPQIPEHWEIRSIHRICRLQGGSGFPVRYQGCYTESIPFIKVNALASHISTARRYDTVSRETAASLGAKVFSRGDIVFAKVGAALLLHRFEVLPFDCCIDNNMMAMYQISENNQWLKYTLSLLNFNSLVNPGAVPSISQSQIAGMSVPCPPRNEQEQIVRYLDSMTAKINKLIRAKKKQIALLQEQRQAIINQAVTKGLDPNVEMKDSGIDWIGEIPKDWRMPHLSFLTTKIGSGKTPRGGAEIYQESGVRFIRSQNVYFNSLVTDNLQYISESIDATMPSTRVLKDDVLLNITGASIGRCCVYRSDLRANVNQHVCIIRCRKDLILPDYLASVLFSRVGQEAISHCQNEGNRESLTFPQIGAFFIPLPSIEEQQQILGFVAGRVKPIEDVIERINKEIDLLGEYKQSLVSSVVTGQIDVRNIPVEDVIPNDLIPEDDPPSEIEDDPTNESEE